MGFKKSWENNTDAAGNFREISKNLGKDQRTIANYFEYLEFGLLIRFVFNYRGSPMASLRKMKKVYLSTPNIAFAFNQDMDRILPFLLENIIATQTDAKFFYRNGFEIDFVIPDNDELIAIEVKKTEKDIKQIRKFRKEFKSRIKKVMIIDLEKEGIVEGIEIIPAWKFLLN